MTQDLKLDSAVPDRGSRYNSAGVLIPGGLPDALEQKSVSGLSTPLVAGGNYAFIANESDESLERVRAAREAIEDIHANLGTPTTPPPA